eukprot:365756-Chlamydomonas_euryale.AAC.15
MQRVGLAVRTRVVDLRSALQPTHFALHALLARTRLGGGCASSHRKACVSDSLRRAVAGRLQGGCRAVAGRAVAGRLQGGCRAVAGHAPCAHAGRPHVYVFFGGGGRRGGEASRARTARGTDASLRSRTTQDSDP